MPLQLHTTCIAKVPAEIWLQKKNILENRLRADFKEPPSLHEGRGEGGFKIEFSADSISRSGVCLPQPKLGIGSIRGSYPADQEPRRCSRANPLHDFGPIR